ncbi:uncharacterized protein [Epargyreus clarus]|uniref:uncharacterized protein isoform X2 n=1 Tax=Epargyreus clarus TaxID=520877 RepID=UPI003C2E0F55
MRNIISSLSSPIPHGDTNLLDEEFNSECDTYVCVLCQGTLSGKRTHFLPEGPERHLISERILPKQIPEGGLVCYACWMKVKRILQQGPVDITFKDSDRNSNICVVCLRCLNQRRSHSLPEGRERNEVISRIHPRQIPLNGRVCYACWISACRNIQRTEKHTNNTNVLCEICRMDLFRRKTHTVASGSGREAVAARIYPHEISKNPILCSSCWRQIEYYQLANEDIETVIPRDPVPIQLDNFAHTPNSSRQCFVPHCKNPERLSVPNSLRKHILHSQKIFITDSARICKEHKSVHNWEFLEQNAFSKNFTKQELESMLMLSIQEINNNLS